MPRRDAATRQLLTNGNIWQGGGDWAPAAAVAAGRFLAVGTERDASSALAVGGGDFERCDLAGGYLVPGFVDAHMHPLFGAVFQESGIPLRDAAGNFLHSPAAVAEAVAAAHAAAPPGEWLVGYGWNPSLRADPLFAREWLDRAAPGRPVYLLSLDAHFSLASSAALERIGELRYPADSGQIPRDAHGRPLGLFLETPQFIASLRVLALLPFEFKAAAFARFQSQALAAGLTAITDIVGDLEMLRFYARLLGAGQLRLRVQVSPYGPMDNRREMAEFLANEEIDPARLALGPVKYLLDGTPGNHNAAWFQPYADEPGTSGFLTIAPDALAAAVRGAVRGGYDLALHAAGDLSVHVALDAIERGAAPASGHGARLRVEHFDNVTAEDRARLPALARLGLVASIQPTHFHPVYVATIERVLGPERMRREYPLASLLTAGLPLALNSDWPAAMTFAPLANLRAACEHGAEALAPAAALDALTAGNAYAAHCESSLGRIAPGYLADAVLLDRNPLASSTADPRILATWIGGDLVCGALPSLRPVRGS